MNVEIRLYKRFDMDLVSLYDSGYSVALMIRDAVLGYANGTPVYFFIDEPVQFDLNDKKNVHMRVTIPDSEQKAVYVLKNIKHGYRNTFCKILLRNALVQQNLSGFFADTALSQLQIANMAGRNVYSYPNVVMCSTLKTANRQEELRNQAATVLGTTASALPQNQPPKRSRKKSTAQAVQPVSPFAAMPYNAYMSGYPQMMPIVPQMPVQNPQVAPNTPIEQPQPAYAAPQASEPVNTPAPPVSEPAVDNSRQQTPPPEPDIVHDDSAVDVNIADDKELLSMFDAL